MFDRRVRDLAERQTVPLEIEHGDALFIGSNGSHSALPTANITSEIRVLYTGFDGHRVADLEIRPLGRNGSFGMSNSLDPRKSKLSCLARYGFLPHSTSLGWLNIFSLHPVYNALMHALILKTELTLTFFWII
jgi:hypothetical protein